MIMKEILQETAEDDDSPIHLPHFDSSGTDDDLDELEEGEIDMTKQNLGEQPVADDELSSKTSPAETKTDALGDDADTDEDEEEEDEDAFKKLEREVNTDKLIDHHPDILQNNYQEILTMCKLIRNDKGVIVDALHKTYPFLSKYEYARIIGIRTKQLNNGADPFVEVERNIIDGFTIATMELEAKKLPFIIARPLPNGSKEYWKLQDLELVHF